MCSRQTAARPAVMETKLLLLTASWGALVTISLQIALGCAEARRQVADALRAVYILLRIGAVWLTLSGKAWGTAMAGFGSGMVAAYCSYAILHSWWSPTTLAVLDAWLPVPSLPHFKQHPLHMFFIHNLIEQVVTEQVKPLPNHAVLFVSSYLALINSCWIWTRQQYTPQLIYIAAPALFWTVAVPWALVRLAFMLRRRHQRARRHQQASLTKHTPASPSSNTAGHDKDQQQAGAQDVGVKAGSESQTCTQAPDTQQHAVQHEQVLCPSAAMQQASKTLEKLLSVSGYSPKLQQRKVTIKVQTEHGPSQLPCNMAEQLQSSLADSGYRIWDVAVRSGCICISVDVVCSETDSSGVVDGGGTCAGAAGEALSHEYSTATHVANALLPLLQPMLQDELASNPTRHTALVQLGDINLAVCWDAVAATWQLKARPSPLHAETASGLFLGVSQQLRDSSSISTLPGAPKHVHTPRSVSMPQLVDTSESDLRSDLRYDSSVILNSNSAIVTGSTSITNSMTTSIGTGSTSLSSAVEAKALVTPSFAATREAEIEADVELGPAYATHATELVHSVGIQVQLLGRASGYMGVTGQLPTIHGWEAAIAIAHENIAPDRLRLLARCSGTYVTTHVQQVLELLPGSTHAAVQLELHVPDNLLPRHHMGGAPVGLLPVTLELWQGALHCISSTPLLLQLPSTVHKDSSHSCWWWGTSKAAMQGAMQDMHHTNAALWDSLQIASGEDIGMLLKAASTWTAFCTDVAYWLKQMPRVACTAGHCVAQTQTPSMPCSALEQPSLTPKELMQMGEQMMQMCRQLGLHGLPRMLRQQQQLVQAWMRDHTRTSHNSSMGIASVTAAQDTSMSNPQVFASSSSSWSQSGRMLQLTARCMMAVFTGFRCEQCEMQFRSNLTQLLAGVQAVPSCLFALVHLLGCYQALKHQDWLALLMTSSLGLIHAAVVLLQLWTWLSKQNAPIDSKLANTLTARMTLSAYCLRVAAQAVFGWSDMAPTIGLQMQLSSGMAFMVVVVSALGEQVSSMLLLPPVLAVVATLFESISIVAMMQRVGALTPHMALVTLTAIMVPRVIVDTCLRVHSLQRGIAPKAAGHSRAGSMPAPVQMAAVNKAKLD